MTIHVQPELDWLAPLDMPGLARVGDRADGGYVLPSSLLTDADTLIAMGLGYSWSFEQDAKRLNPSLAIHVYDHTVGEREYRRDYLIELASWLALQSPWSRVRRRRQRLRDYRQFFRGDVTHYRERIHDRRDDQSVDIPTVFARALGSVFVKMDIEGAEYRVLGDVLPYADRIRGLVVEFHDVGPLRPVFERTVQCLLTRFAIVHLHANNFVPLYRDGFPDALEITFANRETIPPDARRRLALPISLDAPNDPSRPDYRLTFAPHHVINPMVSLPV